MKKFAVVLGAAALGASLLAGCQTAGLDQLNAKVLDNLARRYKK